MNRSAIARATLLVTVLTVASKILGFVRDQGIAVYFGASGQTDAYVVAMTIPNVVAGLLVTAVGTAFLPMFTQRRTQGKEAEAWALSDSVFSVIVILAVIIGIGGVVAAPLLVHLMAPGFRGETLAQAVVATRIIFPAAIFVILAAPVKSILNSRHHFAAPVVGPIVQNIVVLAALAVFVGLSGMGIRGLALGLALGMALSLLVQVPALLRHGFRYRPRLDFHNPAFQRTLALAGPIIISSLLTQVALLVDRSLASRLAAGSIAALSFADKLRQLPLGIFAVAVATVVYPTLAEMAARGDRRGLADTVGMGLRLVLLVTVPAAVGLAVLREPIIRLLFQHGAFDAGATTATAAALLYYAAGMVGLGCNLVLANTFFSLQDTVTPMLVGVGGAAVNIALDYLLVGSMGHAGVALAGSAGALASTAAFWWVLNRRLGTASVGTALSTVKIGVASALMAGALALIQRAAPALPAFAQGRTVQLGLAIGFGAAVYVVSIAALRIEEAAFLWRAVGRRLAARGVAQ